MGLKIVNPFSKVCKPFINLGGQICNLSAPPSPVIEQKLGPFVVKTSCLYICNNPARAHWTEHWRFIGIFEWFSERDEE